VANPRGRSQEHIGGRRRLPYLFVLVLWKRGLLIVDSRLVRISSLMANPAQAVESVCWFL
jgi:hypothetical protein